MTICKQGANRQRIFLRKSAAGETPTPLPAPAVLLRKADDDGGDWSVFYCVVAAPGAEEDVGLMGDAATVDVWDDPAEIRKAAHRLMKNKAYVNSLHDAEAELGCEIVENAVALADFDVVDPAGVATTIRKDSWYVAIEPSADFRAKVDAGDITGVSLEGTGVRVPLAKGKADGTKGVDKDKPQTHQTCAACGSKVKAGVKTCPNCGATVQAKATPPKATPPKATPPKGGPPKGGPPKGKGAIKKMWEAMFPGEPMPDDDIRKSSTFADVIGEREVSDSMWRAWNALEGVVFDAFRDEDEDDPKAIIRQSLDEFRDYLLGKLDAVPSADDRQGLAKELATLRDDADEEDPEDMSDTTDRIEKLEKKLEGFDPTALQKSVDDIAAAVGNGKESGDDKTPTQTDLMKAVEGLADKLDGLDGEFSEIAKSVKAMEEGGSAQDDAPDTQPVRKSTNPLAGILA